MTGDISLKLSARLRERPLERGRSGNPGGRRRGSLNTATPAAVARLAGESGVLARKAVEMALAGRPAQLDPPTETGPTWPSLSPA